VARATRRRGESLATFQLSQWPTRVKTWACVPTYRDSALSRMTCAARHPFAMSVTMEPDYAFFPLFFACAKF
jgi:hypothetical protein